MVDKRKQLMARDMKREGATMRMEQRESEHARAKQPPAKKPGRTPGKKKGC